MPLGNVIGQAKVLIVGDVDPRSIDAAGGKIGSRLKAGAAIGVTAFGTLAVGAIKAVSAFEEAESVQRTLNNTLENMGKSGAVESLDKLSNSLRKKTGVDDEVIKKGQTILATFSEVASSAGKVGGAFERASVLSLDLAATGFGSVEAGSKALGKALQDPEKGISALSRAGVTFTPVQKELIANFVETGDVAAAQNLILAEVEKQVGGNAEAAAKGSAKLKSAIGEAQESLGGLIADLFDTGKDKSLVELAADATFKFSDAVKKFQGSKDWKELKSGIKTFGKDLGTVAVALGSIVKSMDKLSKESTGKGLLGWLLKIDEYTNPLRYMARALERAADAWERLKGAGGDEGPKNIDTELGTMLLGGGSAGGGRVGSGFRLVGENGPEIIELGSGGGYVHNNSETRAIASSGGSSVNITNIFNGPENLAEARRRDDWAAKHGTKFGAMTSAGAL